jgi:hypothetical protein
MPRGERGRQLERPLARAAIVSWMLFLVFLPISAIAHSVDQFWAFEWASQDRGTSAQDYEVTDQVPGDSAKSPFPERVADGHNAWNDVNITDPDMDFARNGTIGNYNPFDACSHPDFRNGLHYRDIANNPLAQTNICRHWTIWGYQMRNFQVTFNPSYSWYTGSDGGGIGNNQNDVAGMRAHEFGHVVGGWVPGWTPEVTTTRRTIRTSVAPQCLTITVTRCVTLNGSVRCPSAGLRRTTSTYSKRLTPNRTGPLSWGDILECTSKADITAGAKGPPSPRAPSKEPDRGPLRLGRWSWTVDHR